MTLTTYDASAPCYTEIAEVGAALTEPGGQPIDLTPFSLEDYVAPAAAGEVVI
jgi:hypothetical protein